MHNQERNKNTKLSPLRYSTFIRARRVKHLYNVRILLLLRSRKIQSKPVSQTWHNSAGHFQLMISLFKLNFHVVHASFFLNLRDWLCYGVAWLDFGTTAKLSEVMWYVNTILIKTHEQFSSDKVTYYVCYRWSEDSGTLSDQRWTGREKESEQKKKHKTRSKENKTNSMLSVYVQVIHDYWSLTVKWKSVKRLLDNIEN